MTPLPAAEALKAAAFRAIKECLARGATGTQGDHIGSLSLVIVLMADGPWTIAVYQAGEPLFVIWCERGEIQERHLPAIQVYHEEIARAIETVAARIGT